MNISEGTLVQLTYQLFFIDGEEVEMVEEADAQEPMQFEFITEPMLPEFEKALDNLKIGDDFDFIITMENAYGPYLQERIVEFPKSDFEVDGIIDEDALAEDMIVPMKDDEGNEYDAFVLENKSDSVVLDFNHPFAGGDLRFTGKVHDVSLPAHKQN